MTDLGQLERQGRWEELHQALVATARAAAGAGERTGLLTRAAAIAEEMLDDIHTAITLYQEVLVASPGHPGALVALERLFTQIEDWGRLVGILELRAELAEAPQDRAAALVRMAQINHEMLADSGRASALCQRALDLDPDNPEAQALADSLLAQ